MMEAEGIPYRSRVMKMGCVNRVVKGIAWMASSITAGSRPGYGSAAYDAIAEKSDKRKDCECLNFIHN